MAGSLDSHVLDDSWQEVNPTLIAALEEVLKTVGGKSDGVKLDENIDKNITEFKLANRPSDVINLSGLKIYFSKVSRKSGVGGFYSIKKFFVYKDNDKRNYPVICKLRESPDKGRGGQPVWEICLTVRSEQRVTINRRHQGRAYLLDYSL